MNEEQRALLIEYLSEAIADVKSGKATSVVIGVGYEKTFRRALSGKSDQIEHMLISLDEHLDDLVSEGAAGGVAIVQ